MKMIKKDQIFMAALFKFSSIKFFYIIFLQRSYLYTSIIILEYENDIIVYSLNFGYLKVWILEMIK